jgi:hypothetical protein
MHISMTGSMITVTITDVDILEIAHEVVVGMITEKVVKAMTGKVDVQVKETSII